MKDFPLPVRTVGPGSQPEDGDELQYLAMPRDMNTFRMPLVPDDADAAALAEARAVLAGFLATLEGWDPNVAAQGPVLDLADVSPAGLAITNEMLGEGEVAIRVDGTRTMRIQETVFTGVWRVCTLDGDGRLASDRLEAGALPRQVVACAREAGAPALPLVAMPAGAMNSPALMREIAARMNSVRPGAAAHVINLTLFPLTPDDQQVLDQVLPVGNVAMISRGFGNCHITSTGLRDVWRVQYFNSMKTLILNTIEIVDVPAVALAAAEDLADSRERLAELVAWIGETCAAQTRGAPH
jgi:hydrogenase-1 operon protein HyaF